MLSGVTLGCARAELDQLIIRKPLKPVAPVKALAIVEAKRNINDLAHGFRLRQENISWLTGDADGYDPQLYRTSQYAQGHFDRTAAHEQDGETFLFDRSSFALFRRESDSGHYLKRLCFVTRAGPIYGVSAGQLSKLMHRVASDERWNQDSKLYWRSLHNWTRSLGREFESPEMLRLYAQSPGLGAMCWLSIGGTAELRPGRNCRND